MSSGRDERQLLLDLNSEDGLVRSSAAVALHSARHPAALDSCLRTLDDAPDMLHADVTPSVLCLIEIGMPSLPGLLDPLMSPNPITRLHAERAVLGITRQRFGFDGLAWPTGAYERWANFWKTDINYDRDASVEARAEAVERLRRWSNP
jgi:hypothetical protein